MAERVFALINYYAREGLWRSLQTVCTEVLKKRNNDPVLIFWRCYGVLMEGNYVEALRELQVISKVQEIELAATAAMLMAHESAKVVDQDAILDLTAQLELEEKTASDSATLHLAALYWHSKQRERARGLVERVMRLQPENTTALTLLGWIIVTQHTDDEYEMMKDDTELEEALQSFDAVLEHDSSDLEALLGKAKVCELKKDYQGSIDLLTEVVVKYSWFVPALVEKARLLLALGDWEQVQELTARILQADQQNIMALCYTALHAMVREGNNKVTAKYLHDIMAALNRHEPKNAQKYYEVGRPFARLAGGDLAILSATLTMAERAVALRNDYAPYLVEVGAQRLLMEDFANAGERFTAALHLDELNIEASCGSLECQIMSGDLDEAAGQIMFLQEMSASSMSLSAKEKEGGELPYITYLRGLLAWKINDTSEGTKQLEVSIQRNLGQAQEQPLGLNVYVTLHPTRITNIVKMMLNSVGGEPRAPTEAPSPVVARCNRILDLLSKYTPVWSECQALQARALYLNGALDAAQRKAADILRSNPDEFTAHLLICNIFVQQEKPQLAMSALDQAVSANFAVRETPLYHIVNAKVLMASAKLEEARKVLEAAMGMPGVRNALTPQQRARAGRKITEPTIHERATIYLLLAEVLAKISKLPDAPEAKKYITDAVREFEGTSEEVRVTVAECELAIARGDVEGALKKLRKIPTSSPHFTKARMAMADIYLKHRKDKTSYIKCYLDLVEKMEDYDSYCMLGEAFMQIQEPEKAVTAFTSALELSPKDAELAAKIARALVTTHNYHHAIDAYNKAIRNAPGHIMLQYELAGLMTRLRQFKPALQTITKALERQKDNPSSVDNLTLDVEGILMQAKVYKGQGDSEQYSALQMKALELQKVLLNKIRGELPEVVAGAREKTALICFDLAEHYKKMRKYGEATDLYNEALRHCENHAETLLSLAKLQLANGDTDACQQTCVLLLKTDPDNEEASVMLAEIMFHKEHFDTAIYHFQQLLEKSPGHYGALAQLIGLLRRAGRLEDVPRYLSLAEDSSPKATMAAGLHYCKGLTNRYTNKPREALKELNLARKDAKWGSQAILHMVEIYLNPDNDAVWEEKENDTPESREAVKTARSLLNQVRAQDTQTLRYRVLDAYALMASKDKNDIEKALTNLLDMANQDPNNVPVLLAMATGFMMLKQTPKARNQLKRVQKIQYKPDEAEEFERSWLLLADIHIQGGKYDLAQDLCQRCLKYNKSCSKAWEYLGAIMEREQSYKDAADHYESAWRHENQASAQVGYKLAFNYLKAKRYVEAIDVCHKVIKAFPDYPKIRKDILEKARQGLKP